MNVDELVTVHLASPSIYFVVSARCHYTPNSLDRENRV